MMEGGAGGVGQPQPNEWMEYFLKMMRQYGPAPATFAPGAELSGQGPGAGTGPGFFNPFLSSGMHSNTSQGGAYERAHGKLSSSSAPTMG